MVYPTLLAAIGDVAHPTWRASSVGVYRLWRDSGFAVGALMAGIIADWLGLAAAIWAVAALTALSGAVVAIRMYETHITTQTHPDIGTALRRELRTGDGWSNELGIPSPIGSASGGDMRRR